MMESENPGRRSYVPTLDGWRAVAISLVIMHHATCGLYSNEADYWQHNSTSFGAFGVDIFFGISGLLITRLLLAEWRDNGRISLTGFYLRRAFRILPPYLLFLLTVVAVGFVQSPLELAACLGFFRNYIPATAGTYYTVHFWSLAVEEHFYLIWPGLLVWFGLKHAKLAAAWLSIGVGLWRVTNAKWPTLPGLFPHFRTDLRLDALLWGCVVAFLLHDQEIREKLGRVLNRRVWTVLLAAAIACIVFYSMLTSLWFAMLVPLLLAGTALHPTWTVSRMLELAPLRWIGRISYSLYVWQQALLVSGWFPHYRWQTLPWNLVLTVCIAVLSYYVVERPLSGLGRRLASQISAKKMLRWPAVPQPAPAGR